MTAASVRGGDVRLVAGKGEIVSPVWRVTNTVSLPTGFDKRSDGNTRYRHAVQFIFSATMMLDNVFYRTPQQGRKWWDYRWLMMASPEALLARPFWNVANTLVLPILTDDNGDGRPTLRSLITLSLPITIFLDVILGEPRSSRSGRSLGEDQLGIFRAIEGSLAGVGVDGRACLLRLICQLQSDPIGKFTVVGEILTLLFTPKHEGVDFLREYQEAQMAGLDGEDCANLYSGCPFSFIHYFSHHNQDPPGQQELSSHMQPSLNNQLISVPQLVLD